MPIMYGQFAKEGHTVMTIAFTPSGGTDPRRAEFAILEQLLAARVRNEIGRAHV